MRSKDNTVISLFSGAMGLDLGIEKAKGFKTRVVVELNNSAIETINANKPKLPVIDVSIKDITTSEILKKAKLNIGEATVVAGGPCCQSFSTVGKRGSLADDRGTLFQDFCRVVREAQPRFFIMENVKGLLSAAEKHRPLNERGPGNPPLLPEEEFGSAFKVVTREIESLGYHCIYSVVNSADYGAPQARQRLLIIGSRDGEDIFIPTTTHSKEGKRKWITLDKALDGVDSTEWCQFAESRLKFFRLLGPGQNWKNLPEHMKKEALGAAYESWGGRSGFCRRLSWDKPSPSLTTMPDGRATSLCHPVEDRPLSVEEYAKIQEFPEGYKFVGSIRQKYTMIGNAVPLSIGEAIGKMFKETIKKTNKDGLPLDADARKGTVKCADLMLEKRLKKRPKTQLHPPHLRKNPDPNAKKKWMSSVGNSIPVTL